MPRYAYRCDKCDTDITIQHLSDEVVNDCPKCEAQGSLTKQLTTFRTNKKQLRKQKVGDTTEKFIQTSRDELRQQKKELEDQR